MVMKEVGKPLIFILSVILSVSCTTQRINQFRTFSTAGKAYTDAMTDLLKEAGEIAIDADNEYLSNNHEKFPKEKRQDTYLGNTGDLREFLKILNDFRMHTQLLGNYFSTLALLAESKSGQSIGDKTSGIVAELQKIHPSVEKARIGDASVKEFLGESVPFVVNQFRKNALENELRENGKIISGELDLQVALVAALSAGIKNDLEVYTNRFETGSVARPYVEDPKLPASWKKDRKSVLILSSAETSVAKAESAAKELKKAFASLAENKFHASDISLLLSDINELIDFVELIRSNKPN